MTQKHPLVASGLLDSKLLQKYQEQLGPLRSIHIEEVTPQKAAQWLEQNNRNRSVRKKQVEYLRRSFLSEGSQFSTDCIAFREDGTLFNGQHRCQAAVSADISFPCLIINGISESAEGVEDHVAPRLARDLVKSRVPELKNANDKVTIPAAYWRLSAMQADSPWSLARWDNVVYTKNHLANFVIENDKKLSWALSCVHSNFDFALFPRGTFAAAALVLRDRHVAATREFFRRVGSGAGLASGDPLLWLRNYSIKQAQAKAAKGTESVDPLQVRIAFLFMCWNAWLENKSISRAPRIYRKNPTTGMQDTILWPVPKRPSGTYKPWV